MLQDYPLGAGGGAFKKVHAEKYLKAAGSDEPARALHNGYLTDATDWGIQGLLLKLLFIAGGMIAAYRTSARCRRAGREDDSLIGTALMAGMIGFLVCCVFGSYFEQRVVVLDGGLPRPVCDALRRGQRAIGGCDASAGGSDHQSSRPPGASPPPAPAGGGPARPATALRPARVLRMLQDQRGKP